MNEEFKPDATTYLDNPGYDGGPVSSLPNDFSSRFVTKADAEGTEFILSVEADDFPKVAKFVAKVVGGWSGMYLVMLKEGVNLRDISDLFGDDPSVIGPNRTAYMA